MWPQQSAEYLRRSPSMRAFKLQQQMREALLCASTSTSTSTCACEESSSDGRPPPHEAVACGWNTPCQSESPRWIMVEVGTSSSLSDSGTPVCNVANLRPRPPIDTHRQIPPQQSLFHGRELFSLPATRRSAHGLHARTASR